MTFPVWLPEWRADSQVSRKKCQGIHKSSGAARCLEFDAMGVKGQETSTQSLAGPKKGNVYPAGGRMCRSSRPFCRKKTNTHHN
jgi:hypothetical protein